MKFLIYKTKKAKPFEPRFRVFLENGTELKGAMRISVSGGVAQRTVTRHSIDEPSPDPLHFEIDRLELEFAGAKVEMINKLPAKRRQPPRQEGARKEDHE